MVYKGSYEDLIYILIGIIWIGYSIYKGVKKSQANKPANKPATSGKPAKTTSKSFLETFLDELTEQNQEPAEMEYVPPETETITEQNIVTEKKNVTENGEKEIFSYDDYYEKSNFDKASDVYKSDAVDVVRAVKKEERGEKPKKRKAKIDLRKAIVYSEILNPRYF